MVERYFERAELAKNAVAKKIFLTMEEKESNLSFNPDVTSVEEFLRLIDAAGPEICMLKTHIDMLEDFSPDVIEAILDLQRKHNFVIFEDRKFADIGNTVQSQYAAGVYKIAEWAELVNAHTVPGYGIIEGLREVGLPKGRATLLLGQMSSDESLATGEYTRKTVEWAKKYEDFVIGFNALERLIDEPQFITVTPGVKLERGTDALGQVYRTPEDVFAKGTDIITVGRGIYGSEDPLQAAKKYREAGWKAYQNRI